MRSQRTISFRIDSNTVDSLDSLAEHLERDRSYLLNEAVEHYLELNQYHTRLIEKGIRAAKEGKFVEHDEVKKRMRKLGRLR
jgi:predicted transcriptional regulator